MPQGNVDVRIRPALEADLNQVIALDQQVTGKRKQAYWKDLYERYRSRRQQQRFFFVAEAAGGGSSRILGFIIGEVRAWEFGSAPCGWVFAISVDPDARLEGVGDALFDTISESFRKLGVSKLRTVVSTGNHLLLSFFRAQGLMAGPYLQLEKPLND